MSYRIITDTCCDLWQQFYDEMGADVVALSVTFRGESYSSYSEPWLRDFYNGLRDGEVATTAAVNPRFNRRPRRARSISGSRSMASPSASRNGSSHTSAYRTTAHTSAATAPYHSSAVSFSPCLTPPPPFIRRAVSRSYTSFPGSFFKTSHIY